jgi:hypothetical protein
MKLIEIAESLINKIKKDYEGDVSLVHVHGSYFYKDTHDLSDLDLYFVPKTKRGYNLGRTFILNGIGCDYWALSWERLERIANHEEKIVSIITEGEILYYHSEEDLKRFNKLKEKAEDTADKERFLNRGKEIMKDAYKEYFKLLGCGDTTEIRKSIIDIIDKLSYALAQINRSPIKRGRKYLKQEIAAMKLVPDDFESIYENLFKETDIIVIKDMLYTLIKNTGKLLISNNTRTFYDNFNGFYEEMIQSYNKIYHACETGEIYTPLFASVELTVEIEELFEKSNCSYTLPDMIAAYDPNDLSKIKNAAKEHQGEFVKVLKNNGVGIVEFDDINGLNTYLEEL